MNQPHKPMNYQSQWHLGIRLLCELYVRMLRPPKCLCDDATSTYSYCLDAPTNMPAGSMYGDACIDIPELTEDLDGAQMSMPTMVNRDKEPSDEN